MTVADDVLRALRARPARLTDAELDIRTTPQSRHPAERRTEQDRAWDRNVQSMVVSYLAAEGWSIIRVADTARRERGADIIAERGDQRLLDEVKGWPGTTYVRGEHAGQPKPTQPTLQATHWFSEAFTSLIRRGRETIAGLAMGLPDMPRYRALLGDAGWAIDPLGFTIYLVATDGTVETQERKA